MPDHVHERTRGRVVRSAVVVALALVAVTARADLASGIAAYASGSYRYAFRELRPLAEEGSAIAQVFVGAMYLEGNGVSRDPGAALRWYHRAADQGHSGAQFKLAELYAAGVDVAPDDEEAERWLRLAALSGHADAQYLLGQRREAETGTRKPDPVALRWYRRAAANGHVQARQRLAELNALGPLPGALRAAEPDRATPQAPRGAPAAKTSSVAAQVIPARAEELRTVKVPVAVRGVPESEPPQAAPDAATAAAPPATAVGGEPLTTAAATGVAPPPAGGDPGFVVQLGSFRREDAARRELAIIRSRHEERLGALGTYVETADLGDGRGIWHRLRAGPVTDFAAARDLCADLRDSNPRQGCLPVRVPASHPAAD